MWKKKTKQHEPDSDTRSRQDFVNLYQPKVRTILQSHSEQQILSYLQARQEYLDGYSQYIEPNAHEKKQIAKMRKKPIPPKQDIFDNSKWGVRFNSKFLEKIKADSNILESILLEINLLANGILCHKQSVSKDVGYIVQCPSSQGWAWQRYFLAKITKNQYLLVKFCVEQEGNYYSDVMIVMDLINQSIIKNQKRLNSIIAQFQKLQKQSRKHSRGEIRPIVQNKKNYMFKWFEVNENNHKTKETINISLQPKINQFDCYSYHSSSNKLCISQKQEAQLSEFEENIMVEKNDYYFLTQQGLLLNVFANISKASGIYIKLTLQEQEVIASKENLCIIGRSGTGKTTCAILRLLCIEQISNHLLNNVFLTASTHLISEIKSCYQTYVKNIKNQQEELTEETVINSSQRPEDNQFIEVEKLDQAEYPVFSTIQNFIGLLDDTLRQPFVFNRNQLRNRAGLLYYHGQRNQDQNQFAHSTLDLRYKIKVHFQQFVTYNVFKNYWQHFTKNLKITKKITCIVVWTEIYSVIKGHPDSHLFKHGWLPLEEYIKIPSSFFLQKSDKKEIYQLFQMYQKFKLKQVSYDLPDMVNYILQNYETSKFLKTAAVSFLLIDEIQDLNMATIYLLCKFVKRGFFCSGDSAQAITKGVSFKFAEVGKIFHHKAIKYPLKLQQPQKIQLTKSFRSRNRILRLANSVIQIIKCLFPDSIDILKAQFSEKQGLMPIITSDKNVIARNYPRSSQAEQRGFMNAIIARSQENFQQLRQDDVFGRIVENFNCLTIQQCKGLQFQEVIVYNFFRNSSCKSLWNILQYIKIVNESYVFYPFGFYESIHNYLELNSELKILYTILTRARAGLIFYEESTSTIQNLTTQLWKQYFIDHHWKGYQMKEQQKCWENQYCGGFLSYEDKIKQQGKKMEQMGNYNQALRWYEKCNDMICYQRVKAKKKQKAGLQQLQELEIQINNNGSQAQDQTQRKQMARKHLKEAAQLFQNIGIFKSAGKCYFTAHDYQSAYRCFDQIGLHYQAGESAFANKEYGKAVKKYLQAQSFSKYVLSLIRNKCQIKALKELHKYKTKIPQAPQLARLSWKELMNKISKKIVEAASLKLKQTFNVKFDLRNLLQLGELKRIPSIQSKYNTIAFKQPNFYHQNMRGEKSETISLNLQDKSKEMGFPLFKKKIFLDDIKDIQKALSLILQASKPLYLEIGMSKQDFSRDTCYLIQATEHNLISILLAAVQNKQMKVISHILGYIAWYSNSFTKNNQVTSRNWVQRCQELQMIQRRQRNLGLFLSNLRDQLLLFNRNMHIRKICQLMIDGGLTQNLKMLGVLDSYLLDFLMCSERQYKQGLIRSGISKKQIRTSEYFFVDKAKTDQEVKMNCLSLIQVIRYYDSNTKNPIMHNQSQQELVTVENREITIDMLEVEREVRQESNNLLQNCTQISRKREQIEQNREKFQIKYDLKNRKLYQTIQKYENMIQLSKQVKSKQQIRQYCKKQIRKEARKKEQKLLNKIQQEIQQIQRLKQKKKQSYHKKALLKLSSWAKIYQMARCQKWLVNSMNKSQILNNYAFLKILQMAYKLVFRQLCFIDKFHQPVNRYYSYDKQIQECQNCIYQHQHKIQQLKKLSSQQRYKFSAFKNILRVFDEIQQLQRENREKNIKLENQIKTIQQNFRTRGDVIIRLREEIIRREIRRKRDYIIKERKEKIRENYHKKLFQMGQYIPNQYRFTYTLLSQKSCYESLILSEFTKMQSNYFGSSSISDDIVVDWLSLMLLGLHDQRISGNPQFQEAWKILFFHIKYLPNKKSLNLFELLLTIFSCRFIHHISGEQGFLNHNYVLLHRDSILISKLKNMKGRQTNFQAFYYDSRREMIIVQFSTLHKFFVDWLGNTELKIDKDSGTSVKINYKFRIGASSEEEISYIRESTISRQPSYFKIDQQFDQGISYVQKIKKATNQEILQFQMNKYSYGFLSYSINPYSRKLINSLILRQQMQFYLLKSLPLQIRLFQLAYSNSQQLLDTKKLRSNNQYLCFLNKCLELRHKCVSIIFINEIKLFRPLQAIFNIFSAIQSIQQQIGQMLKNKYQILTEQCIKQSTIKLRQLDYKLIQWKKQNAS